jgi:hypothetical protein
MCGNLKCNGKYSAVRMESRKVIFARYRIENVLKGILLLSYLRLLTNATLLNAEKKEDFLKGLSDSKYGI